MLKLFKRPFCKHIKTRHVGSYMDDAGPGRFRARHVWKCENCGKTITGGK